MNPLRVVVADDSSFVRRLVSRYLEEAEGIRVVATAHDGFSAIDAVVEHRPDALTLDLEMPGMDGLEALRHLMAVQPTPVVVISGVSGGAATRTLAALDAGAVDFVLKYSPEAEVEPEALRREIVAKVRAAAGVRVIRSLAADNRRRIAARGGAPAPAEPPVPAVADASPALAAIASIAPLRPGVAARGSVSDVVVIGASTGGPVALRELLEQLPADFPAAIVVVQHMPASFTPVLAAQLHRQTQLSVREARQGDTLAAGEVLVAPGSVHLFLERDGRVALGTGPPVGGHRPSIDVTMQSASLAFGARVRGVLLTGMGEDGVEGLRAIREHGGGTLAQREEGCAVFGMPRRAIERRVVDVVGSPGELGLQLARGGERWRLQA